MLSKINDNQTTSDLLNNTARGYLTQGQQDSGYVPPPTTSYVNGVGMLGPDLGGYVKGVQALQDYRMNESKNKRDNALAGAVLNESSMKSKSFEHEQAIQAGMSQAAQQGGYHGVIDYLRNADPVMALQFEKAKSELDKSIMENQTYQLAHSNDKTEVMLQGYQMLGGIGATLLKAKPEERDATYQSLLPVIKQIDPNMPDKLDTSAVAKLGLGMSLSTPAAILYDTSKQIGKSQSEMGQLLDDYQRAVMQYGADSQQASILKKSINDKNAYLDRLQLQTANTVATNNRSGESQLRNQWFQQTKSVNQMAQSNSAVQMASKSATNPDGSIKGPDDMAVIYNYYKMLDPNSVIMPGEYANAENTKGWTDAMRVQYNKVWSGDKLDDRQREAFAKSAQDLFENKAQSYYSLKSQFSDIAKRNGFNPENVIVDQVQSLMPKPPDAAIQYLQQNNTPELQRQFQLKYGQDALNQALGSENAQ